MELTNKGLRMDDGQIITQGDFHIPDLPEDFEEAKSISFQAGKNNFWVMQACGQIRPYNYNSTGYLHSVFCDGYDSQMNEYLERLGISSFKEKLKNLLANYSIKIDFNVLCWSDTILTDSLGNQFEVQLDVQS